MIVKYVTPYQTICTALGDPWQETQIYRVQLYLVKQTHVPAMCTAQGSRSIAGYPPVYVACTGCQPIRCGQVLTLGLHNQVVVFLLYNHYLKPYPAIKGSCTDTLSQYTTSLSSLNTLSTRFWHSTLSIFYLTFLHTDFVLRLCCYICIHLSHLRNALSILTIQFSSLHFLPD